MTDPKYGAVVTSDGGHGSMRLMLIHELAAGLVDKWAVLILRDHNDGTMYGGAGNITTITNVRHLSSQWQKPKS